MDSEKQVSIIGIVMMVLGCLLIPLLLLVTWALSVSFLDGDSNIFLLIVILFIPVLMIVTGYYLRKYKKWARITAIILAIFTLTGFPIGTALGIWFLIVLFNEETKRLFN